MGGTFTEDDLRARGYTKDASGKWHPPAWKEPSTLAPSTPKPSRSKGDKPTEHKIQCDLFEWLSVAALMHPALKLAFAVPNGGARSAITGAMMKAEGVKKGVPDIMLPVARGHHHGLFVEMKRPGGQVSDDQRQWISNLKGQNYRVEVCFSTLEAIKVFEEYITCSKP